MSSSDERSQGKGDGKGDWTRTAPCHDEPIKLRSRKVCVEVVRGPAQGLKAELHGHGARIGSGPGADLILPDPTVSRHHLTVRIEGESIRVVDNKSRNGTVLDGVRVFDAYARPDATLLLGTSMLRLRMLDEAIEIPLSAKDRFGSMLGRSVAMRRLFGLLELVAPTDMTVLVEGETGTGKELVAEGIHRHSRRDNGPLVVFDCSAIPATLIEGELFGTRRTAYTGAGDRGGRFKEAHGGTLFLDEIGELPLELQPKLLRALERREVRRLGDDEVRKVDVRIVAATNRSLNVEVERGRFREDLYHRLAEVVVQVPTLRNRLDDIPLLARHFEAEFRAQSPESPPLPDTTIAGFQQRSWPGNVRELRHKIRLAMLLGAERSEGPKEEVHLALEDIPVNLDEHLFKGIDRIKEGYERAYILKALEKTSYNVTHTAELAGVGRRYIQRAMERHGLRNLRGPGGSQGSGETVVDLRF
ncbi:sigma 54-dependent Fis family transcriptional regulator [Polyangium sp. 15x6]|uniref:sigma 54-dependent Fis family transcriptional regulator n=1 Tax=Polyangium sp. 15x6 TaxID=3042687 RepID=UPI00249AA39D|nr:sigma 54-dependent Fis family transcriptional regulator [Polyangium sp. 15x6]MDI3287349.1 sigma 54-dependent Fis family transcriptional regulator [Polyangium sp. 15x6]